MMSCLLLPRYVPPPDLFALPGIIFSWSLHDLLSQVEKEIGEKRVISFHGVGLSVAPEIRFDEVAGSYENPDEVSSLNLLW